MAQTPEGKVKAKLKKVLDEMGIWHFSPFQAGMGRAGIPDVIACYEGRFVAFECKAGRGKQPPFKSGRSTRYAKPRGLRSSSMKRTWTTPRSY